jgi:hypothetical protein
VNEATSRAVANVVVASAALAAAYVIFTTPSLRRLLIRGTTAWLGGTSIPGFLIGETGRAWIESAPRSGR